MVDVLVDKICCMPHSHCHLPSYSLYLPSHPSCSSSIIAALSSDTDLGEVASAALQLDTAVVLRKAQMKCGAMDHMDLLSTAPDGMRSCCFIFLIVSDLYSSESKAEPITMVLMQLIYHNAKFAQTVSIYALSLHMIPQICAFRSQIDSLALVHRKNQHIMVRRCTGYLETPALEILELLSFFWTSLNSTFSASGHCFTSLHFGLGCKH
ncbi:hypothetical protein JOB18_007321, partial [Solea senegalensis]